MEGSEKQLPVEILDLEAKHSEALSQLNEANQQNSMAQESLLTFKGRNEELLKMNGDLMKELERLTSEKSVDKLATGDIQNFETNPLAGRVNELETKILQL